MKTAKRKVSPCVKCKGFAVPGHVVKSVARSASGRFVKRR